MHVTEQRLGFLFRFIAGFAIMVGLGGLGTEVHAQITSSRWVSPRKKKKPAQDKDKSKDKDKDKDESKDKDKDESKDKDKDESKDKDKGTDKDQTQKRKKAGDPKSKKSGQKKPARKGAKPSRKGAKPSRKGAKPSRKGAKPSRKGAKPAPKNGKAPDTPPKKKLMPWSDDPSQTYGTHLPWRKGSRPPSKDNANKPVAQKLGTKDAKKAAGEKKTDVKKSEKPPRVAAVKAIGPKKTSPDTLRAIADVKVGDVITKAYLEKVRKRVINSKLFRKVEVFYERVVGRPGWANLYVEAKDRHSWFIAPMFSWEDGRYGGALAYGECNLFGWGKRIGVAARYLTDSQGIGIGYQDPAVLSSHMSMKVGLGFERKLLSEYVRTMGKALQGPLPARQIWIQQLFASLHFGYTFLRRLNVQAGYKFGLVAFKDPKCLHQSEHGGDLKTGCGDPDDFFSGRYTSPIAFEQPDGSWRGETYGGPKFWRWKREGVFQLNIGYSTVVDIYGVKDGWKVAFKLNLSHPHLGSEFQFVKWVVKGSKAFRFLKTHYVALSAKHEQSYGAPFHREPYMGGSLLPGYTYRLAVGDTNTSFTAAYNMPLFKVWWFHFRQVFYYRNAWIFFRDGGGKAPYFKEHDGVRRYHLAHTPGPTDRASFLQCVATGLRLYVKAVAIPLLGVDVAYGFESQDVRFYFYVGKHY
jgi:hypothetical protein